MIPTPEIPEFQLPSFSFTPPKLDFKPPPALEVGATAAAAMPLLLLPLPLPCLCCCCHCRASAAAAPAMPLLLPLLLVPRDSCAHLVHALLAEPCLACCWYLM